MSPADPASVASGPAPAVAPTSARGLIEGQLAALTRLTEIGMEIAEAVGREAKAAGLRAEPDAPRPDFPLLFARVSRAVRMTIALQSRLMKDLAALDRADEMAERARAAKRRIRLGQMVEQAAEAAVDAQRAAGRRFADEDAVEDEIEQLSEEVYERLTDAEDHDLSGRPLGDAVAAICKDLGLTPDWTARLLTAMGGGDAPSLSLPPWEQVPANAGDGGSSAHRAAASSPLHRPWGGPPPPEREETAENRPVRSEFNSAPPRAPP